MTAAMATLSIGANVAQLAGQTQAYNANAANAAKSMRIQNQQTNFATQQRESADSVNAQQTQADMLRAAATARASAGESGTSGNSVDALIGDYYASEGRYMNNLAVQQGWNRQQANLTLQGQSAQAQAQINRVPKPDFIGAALRIGADTLSAYNQNYGKDATR